MGESSPCQHADNFWFSSYVHIKTIMTTLPLSVPCQLALCSCAWLRAPCWESFCHWYRLEYWLEAIIHLSTHTITPGYAGFAASHLVTRLFSTPSST